MVGALGLYADQAYLFLLLAVGNLAMSKVRNLAVHPESWTQNTSYPLYKVNAEAWAARADGSERTHKAHKAGSAQ